ncbi:nose resistant to fluoxetine protein 6-like [Daphnia carinata]|uniref:nose resistant to fluoxetine protein 6-like n=1 Tax=Daphnia carinata TaxID=120202 RepID=UPI00257D69C7|nr:nose resistant to fluoxetine protein 6-like [Daphnia carinata]
MSSSRPLFVCLVVFSIFPHGFIVSGLTLPPVGENGNQGIGDWWIYSSVPTALAASNVSETCIQHSREYLVALRDRQTWAVKMYESSGRLIENLIYIEENSDVHHETGLFDGCVSVQSDGIPFQGQYCTVFFGLKQVDSGGISNSVENWKEEEPIEKSSNFLKPSVGFCLPSTCSARDLRSAVAQQVGYRVSNGKNFSIVATSSEDYCYTQEKILANGTIDNLALIVLSVFCFLGIVVTVATVHHTWTNNDCDDSRKPFAIQLLHCFSAKRNCKTLLSVQEDAKDSLACLHGIRVLTICWVVLMHVGSEFTIERISYNKQTAVKNSLRWEVQGLANGLFAVDSFFLMSGLLVAFTQMRQLDQNNGFFNIKRFYFHRYIRLTPVYAAVMAFIATLWPRLGSGPDWHFLQQMSKGVRQRWWTNMLYINNYVATTELSMSNPLMGMIESWSLACDMQMLWISPLFIYPLWRWKKAGLLWTVVCLLISLGYSAILFFIHDLPASLTPLGRPSQIARIDDYVHNHYLDTFSRIPAYLIGILLGWILHNTKNRKVYMNKYLAGIGWIIATLFALAVIYGMTPYLDETTVPVVNPFIRISYGAFHHSAWAIAVGWIIFTCTHGYGGFINQFLSWKLFLPFSRLSYAAYLIHYNMIKAYASHLRKPFYFTECVYATTYVGILVITFAIAFVLSVVVEMPFLNLDKFFFPIKSKNQQGKKKT